MDQTNEQWRASIVVLAGIVVITLLIQFEHDAFGCLYSLPVVFAAFRGGWKGGIATAALAALIPLAVQPLEAKWVIGGVSLLSLGALVASMSEEDRRQKNRYQKLAEQLSDVYAKVQANFDGMKRVERLSALGQLSAGLAHEIRNPLASISGSAGILQRNQNLDARQLKCVEIITQECHRLDELLTNFLNFAGPRSPRLQLIEIDSVLDRVLALTGHGVRGKSVRFEKNIPPSLPPVECDPEQLEQVLLNLMINAIEASPDGETVALSAGLSGRQLAVRVIDHGSGVAPAHIDRLFDPFFTTKEHGTGLGLPVAHQIMRQMGGGLLAHRNSGQGMTFTVILPVPEQTQ